MLADAEISARFAANTAAVGRAHGDAASPCARSAVRHIELLPIVISATAPKRPPPAMALESSKTSPWLAASYR